MSEERAKPLNYPSQATITKAKIVDYIGEELKLSRRQSMDSVETLLEIIKESLETQETVKISGFGNFVVHQKSPRRGRNPQTHENLEISGRNVVLFRPSKLLKNRINDSLL